MKPQWISKDFKFMCDTQEERYSTEYVEESSTHEYIHT